MGRRPPEERILVIRSYQVFLSCWLACTVIGGCVAPPAWPTVPNYSEDQLLVRWKDGITEIQKGAVRNTVGGRRKIEYSLVEGLELMQIDTGSILLEKARANLDASQAVRYAEFDYYVSPFLTPDDHYFGRQWNMENGGGDVGPFPGIIGADIEAEEGWNIFTGSPDFIIAVIDSGMQLDHPDLEPNLWRNELDPIDGLDNDGNGKVDDFVGWDFVTGDNEPDDPEGHGTHVAGIIGAIGNNAIGVAGINWECSLMPLRFIGSGRGMISGAISALEYAVDHDVRVSCNSWGDDDHSQPLEDAIAAAGDKNHIFVTSAGNGQTNIDAEKVYPAALSLPNIITVASIDHRDRLTPKSNWGEGSVDIAAPGVYVLSTSNDSSYQFLSGTSMAAAHVAGVVAMVAAYRGGTAESIIDKVLASVRDVGLGSQIKSGGVVSLSRSLK